MDGIALALADTNWFRRSAEGRKASPPRPEAEAKDDAAGNLLSSGGGDVAHVILDKTTIATEGGPVELGPGMNVTAEIKTGQRTVLSYLLSPVIRYRQESIRVSII